MRSIAKEVIAGPIATRGAPETRGISDPVLRAFRARVGVLLSVPGHLYRPVEVTSDAPSPLPTVTLRDQHGQPLVDSATGKACRIAILADE